MMKIFSDGSFEHICEVCGRKEVLTPDEAFNRGWDYPPNFGSFGVLSPRTCPNCSITETLWWKTISNKDLNISFTEKDIETTKMFLKELDREETDENALEYLRRTLKLRVDM